MGDGRAGLGLGRGWAVWRPAHLVMSSLRVVGPNPLLHCVPHSQGSRLVVWARDVWVLEPISDENVPGPLGAHVDPLLQAAAACGVSRMQAATLHGSCHQPQLSHLEVGCHCGRFQSHTTWEGAEGRGDTLQQHWAEHISFPHRTTGPPQCTHQADCRLPNTHLIGKKGP